MTKASITPGCQFASDNARRANDRAVQLEAGLWKISVVELLGQRQANAFFARLPVPVFVGDDGSQCRRDPRRRSGAASGPQ